jgi:hypothetical protein
VIKKSQTEMGCQLSKSPTSVAKQPEIIDIIEIIVVDGTIMEDARYECTKYCNWQTFFDCCCTPWWKIVVDLMFGEPRDCCCQTFYVAYYIAKPIGQILFCPCRDVVVTTTCCYFCYKYSVDSRIPA